MDSSQHPSPQGRFATTQWSMVADAAGGEATEDSRRALEDLCQLYWYPLYAFVRRQGCQASEAEDLTQEFFHRMLDRNLLEVADRERGRFRTFLLTSLTNFMANERRRATAQKRGGGARILSIDYAAAENRYLGEPRIDRTPEREFDRRWAMLILRRAMAALRAEYLAQGKESLFDELKPRLGGEAGGRSYAEIGRALNMSEAAVKVSAHRMRSRCRDLLRDEIARTVTSDEEVDDELRNLFQALAP